MRSFETVILLLSLIAILAPYLPAGRLHRGLAFLPAVIAALTVVHLIVEQYRWQMGPAYVLAAALLLLSLPGLLRGAPSPPARGPAAFAAGAFGLAWWLIAAALPVALPVPVLPAPPGPYPVASVVYEWIDPARPEAYSADPNDNREVVVQIWYPAQPGPGAATIPLVDHWDAAGPALAQSLGVPAFALGHVPLVRTHTYADAPIQEGGAPYPVVIYSHGYTSYRTASFSLMEALASSGYIVAAIDHPYGAAVTAFTDGRVVLNRPDILPPAEDPGYGAAREALEATFAADQRFVMDQLQLLNAGQLDARFAGKLDPERIGLTGVSTGGGAIVWACRLDARCQAGLALDGWYEPLPEAVLAEPLRQPFMFMQSETRLWKFDNQARLDDLSQGLGAPAYHLKLSGVLHYDFGDYPLLSPLNGLLPERGSLDGERTLKIVSTYALAFFDRYLKGQPAPFLDGPSLDYPEVQFESRSP